MLISDDDVLRTSAYRRGVREYVLRRDRFCVLCAADGRNVESEHADHIKPRSEGGAVFDPKNMQGLCAKCHQIKTNRERWNRHAEPPKMLNGKPNPAWLDWRDRKINAPLPRHRVPSL